MKKIERSELRQTGFTCNHRLLIPCPVCHGWGVLPAGTIEVEVDKGRVVRTYLRPNGRRERCGNCMTLGLVVEPKELARLRNAAEDAERLIAEGERGKFLAGNKPLLEQGKLQAKYLGTGEP